MHSASVTFYRGVLNEKMLKKSEPVTIQRTMGVHPRFGTDKSVPYEHIPPNINFPNCELEPVCVSLLLCGFSLGHPFQVIVVGAVFVDDGAIGLEGNHPVTGGGQHFVVVGGQQHHARKGF